MPPPSADPDQFEEAIRAFRQRVPMSEAQWRALTDAEREFAFTVAGAAQADLVTEAWEAVDRAITHGTTLEDFKREIGGKLEAAWGREDPARLETIFRTNVLGAYNAGRHAILNDPAVKKARPFLRFDAVMDNRTSEICDALDGTIRPADDPFWHSHTPPLHFQCRSILTPLTDEEAEDEGIDTKGPDVDADEGFGRAPTGAGGGDWEPKAKDYPEPIAEVLEEKLAEPVDHGLSLPLLEPELAPESLPAQRTLKWDKRTPAAFDFLHVSQENLAEVSSAVQRFVDAPGSIGATSHVVGDSNFNENWAGVYNKHTRQIQLNEKVVGEPLRRALQRGRVVDMEEKGAFETNLHEQMHAASNPRHAYESTGAASERTSPGAAMEEATTELLAQHYQDDYIRKVIGLEMDGEAVRSPPIFTASADGVRMNRRIAYADFVKGFARVVAFVDELATSKLDETFQRKVAGRALQVKRLEGTVANDQRYGVLVRPLLDRHGILPTHPHRDTIVAQIRETFGEFIQGRGKWREQKESDMRAAVDGIIKKHAPVKK